MLVLYGGVRILNNITYEQDVGGHLKRAADANQPQLALEEINIAIKGMERLGLCNEIESNPKAECYTSVLYTTPNEDIGFWRTNIIQTARDLENLPAESSHLDISLIKIRETLLDGGKTVTDPEGISIYPRNTLWAVFWVIGLVILFVAIVWFYRVELWP